MAKVAVVIALFLALAAPASAQCTAKTMACGTSSYYAKAFRLPVTAGQAFTVDYTATYPVYIEIDGPDSSGAFRSSTGTSLTTAYVAPATGNVTIWAYSKSTTPVSGNFTLTLTPLDLPPCGKVRAVKH